KTARAPYRINYTVLDKRNDGSGIGPHGERSTDAIAVHGACQRERGQRVPDSGRWFWSVVGRGLGTPLVSEPPGRGGSILEPHSGCSADPYACRSLERQDARPALQATDPSLLPCGSP